MKNKEAAPAAPLHIVLMTIMLVTGSAGVAFAQPAAARAAASASDTANGFETVEKIDLWDNATGPHLRGASIAQRRRYPEIKGDMDEGFLGPDPMGVPYRQKDFDKLAALGANAVIIAHPGPYGEAPPFALDETAQANLDRLIGLAEQADLFVVISFRAGPGRSEFTFHPNSGDTWFPATLFNDSVWKDPAAQQAWVDMWRHVAARYRDRKSVVGYDLMCEPNSHLVGSGPDDRLEVYDPAEFHRRYGGTSYDWNQLYPRIVTAIREVDATTPILISGNGYASVSFLPYVKVLDDPKAVYAVHQYEPWQYTHQDRNAAIRYPGRVEPDYGAAFDIGVPFLEGIYATLDRFRSRHNVRIAVTEYGVKRYAPGGPAFLADQAALIEARSANSFLWHWPTSHTPYESVVNDYNYLYGTAPDSKTMIADSPYEPVLRAHWGKNELRPSLVRFGSAP